MIPDSTNVRVMADNIRKLKTEVENAVELPTVTGSDEGKILTVNSSGKWAALDPASQLPDKTDADTGDVLGLTGEGKVPNWITPYNPPAYSSTEVETGKIFDNKPVYCKYVTGDLPDTTGTVIAASIDVGSNIVLYDLYVYKTITTYNAYSKQSIYLRNGTGEITFDLSNTQFLSGRYVLYVEYTKPDPVPEEATKTKRKTTKGEN